MKPDTLDYILNDSIYINKCYLVFYLSYENELLLSSLYIILPYVLTLKEAVTCREERTMINISYIYIYIHTHYRWFIYNIASGILK